MVAGGDADWAGETFMKDLKRKNKYSVDPFPPDPEFTKGEMIACPASAEFLDPLSEGYKLHWVHPSKLVNGVCPSCAKKFAKHSLVPSDRNHHSAIDECNDADGDTSGNIKKAVFFNHDEIDALLGTVDSAPDDARQMAGEVIREIFIYCFGVQYRRKGGLKLAASKLAVIAAGLQPSLLNGATQEQIAKQLGLTKAAVSWASVRFRDAFNLDTKNGRTEAQREAMRKARLSNPVGRHFKKQP